MLRALLAKDLRRAWRNPLPWLINLALPLCITALVGLAFGGNSDNGALGRVKFAVVDEDNSPLTGMLRGTANQGDAAKYLEPVFLDRAEALRQINDSKLSAVLIIPTNFTRDYLNGSNSVKLELVKNPAESIHPAVLEEMFGVVVTGLNALARNFQSQFPVWRAALEGDLDYHKVSTVIEQVGNKLETAKKYINPPLVSYQKVDGVSTNADDAGKSGTPQPAKAKTANGNSRTSAFAYILLGLTAMFLLFLAGMAMIDLQRELRFRTFERYQTMREHLLPFVAGKLVFAVVMLLICSTIMLGGGGLIFQVSWERLLPLAVLTFAYICFAAGLMALLTAWMPDERRGNVLINVAGMILGMAGGCTFPVNALPQFVGRHLTPLMPSFWYVDAARSLEFGGSVSWTVVAIKLAVVSAVLLVLAVRVFHQRFQSGVRV